MPPHSTQPGSNSDSSFEPPVEVDRVHHHLRQRDRAAQLADEAGRVEGRARGELRALEQDDVLPAQFRQVVGERGAADAAADDHAAGAVGQLSPRHRRPPPARSRSRGRRRSSRIRLEVLVGVVGEVEVEVGEGALEDPPHRLAEVGHEPHQPQRGESGRRSAGWLEVGVEQGRLLALVELVVDGEVAEVEVAVPHPRVLPVDDPDPVRRRGGSWRRGGRCGRAPGRARARLSAASTPPATRASPTRSPRAGSAPRSIALAA